MKLKKIITSSLLLVSASNVQQIADLHKELVN